jgi:hypothetical protein
MAWLVTTKFWFSLILAILSTICSVLIFIYFYRQQKKLTIHHHLTLILVVLSFVDRFTDVPFMLIYYHYGRVIPASDAFCLWWNWWSYSLLVSSLFAMAWVRLNVIYLFFIVY